MPGDNTYSPQDQARKFFFKRLAASVWKIINELAFLFVKLFRFAVGLFMEFIGKK